MATLTTAALPSRFPLGDLGITPGALEHLLAAGVSPAALLARHATGDWGDVCAEDARLNDQDLVLGNRLLSSYDVAGEKVWIIIEWDRSRTTTLLAREY